eukprot:10074995-Heterocapsa_arctica.AAC.1
MKLEEFRQTRSVRKPTSWTSTAQMTQEGACWSRWKRGSRHITFLRRGRTAHARIFAQQPLCQGQGDLPAPGHGSGGAHV